MYTIRPNSRKNTLLRVIAGGRRGSSAPLHSHPSDRNHGPAVQAHDASRDDVACDENAPFRSGDQFLHWMPVH